MRKNIFFIVTFLFPFLLFAQNNEQLESSRVAKKDTAIYRISIENIPKISLHDQEYSIKFWMEITYKNRGFSFEKYLKILDAKKTEINVVHSDTSLNKDTTITIKMEIFCTLFQIWDIEVYPFDMQHLNLRIYNAAFDTTKLILKYNGNGSFQYRNGSFLYEGHDAASAVIELEEGWHIHEAHLSDTSTKVPSDNENIYSVSSINIDTHISSPIALFFKLFVGMYVAFCVAYLAFYIDVKHVEPRFGLPVGALFAAIANKYIVESILPESLQTSLSDWLHSFTFLVIILIIVFSAISLKLELIESTNKKSNKEQKKNSDHIKIQFKHINLLQ